MLLGHFYIFFLSYFTFVESKPLMSVSQDLNIILSCNSTSSVDKKILNLALVEKRFENDTDEKFKCFLYCLYHKYNWMDNYGVFQYDEIRRALLETNLDEISMEYLTATCTETEVKNKCEKAYLFTKCFWAEGKKLEQNHLLEQNEYY